MREQEAPLESGARWLSQCPGAQPPLCKGSMVASSGPRSPHFLVRFALVQPHPHLPIMHYFSTLIISPWSLQLRNSCPCMLRRQVKTSASC